MKERKAEDTHAVQPVAVRKVCSIFHLCMVNCDAIRYGEYMPEATRAAPKATPEIAVSSMAVCVCGEYVAAVQSR